MQTVQKARTRIALLEPRLATHEAELAKSLINLNSSFANDSSHDTSMAHSPSQGLESESEKSNTGVRNLLTPITLLDDLYIHIRAPANLRHIAMILPWVSMDAQHEDYAVLRAQQDETEKWEKGKRGEGEKSGVSMRAPNVASGPTKSTISSARAVAATNATRSRSQSTPFERVEHWLGQPFIRLVASTIEETRSDVVARTQGVEHYGSTVYGGACSAWIVFSISTSSLSSIISSHSSSLIETSALLHCACSYQHQTVSQPTNHHAESVEAS
ncbi:hypothetical protein BKA70DRAFT_1440685 [Coprinopsis sp. MPI-PUGE-AT-0042]|nr:hypothetical protein BKA70DRAFT_1440685 [Coprinopsis sp. MPI-PUGE-AT-0042]